MSLKFIVGVGFGFPFFYFYLVELLAVCQWRLLGLRLLGLAGAIRFLQSLDWRFIKLLIFHQLFGESLSSLFSRLIVAALSFSWLSHFVLIIRPLLLLASNLIICLFLFRFLTSFHRYRQRLGVLNELEVRILFDFAERIVSFVSLFFILFLHRSVREQFILGITMIRLLVLLVFWRVGKVFADS